MLHIRRPSSLDFLMSGTDEVDPHLLEFARQVAAIPDRISGDDGATEQSRRALSILPADQTATIASPPKTNKNLRTPETLAHMILTSLQELDDYPGQGFLITVYGSNPWGAMLTIRPEAGPRIDRALWLSRVQDITAQLRTEFDIVDETDRP